MELFEFGLAKRCALSDFGSSEAAELELASVRLVLSIRIRHDSGRNREVVERERGDG